VTSICAPGASVPLNNVGALDSLPFVMMNEIVSGVACGSVTSGSFVVFSTMSSGSKSLSGHNFVM
jgi:hypothetical protein